MKTRLLIIIGILIAIAISIAYVSIAYNQEIKLATGMMISDEKPQPSMVSDPICFVVDRSYSDNIGSDVTMDACFTLNQFEEMGCTKPMLEHLLKHSNLLDYDLDGLVYLNDVGLPDVMSQEKFDECFDAISEKRPILNSISDNGPKPCPDGQDYNQVLFKCVASCEDDLVYNGYTDSCTMEFELKYHGFCNEGYTYQPSTHLCLSNGDDFSVNLSHEPLKDPPRTAPPEPEPEPEPFPDSESLQRQKQQQAKLEVQKWILTDTRDRVNQINAIREYRDEFESGYFLEQFIHPINQNYEKNKLMHFIYGEWGFQQTENTSPKVTVYFRSYENYDKIEKINEWQKPKDDVSIAISHDSDGFLLMGLHGMPPATGTHETCVIPGEYRVSASNPNDKSKVAWGYFTCQNSNLVGEPPPWMGLPE